MLRNIMENTAKNFALQLGALIALYVSIGALIMLLFSTINVIYPDLERYPWEVDSASSTIRGAIAALIVFFPAYLVLTRIVNKIRRAEDAAYSAFTKWLLYLSLLIGGGVLLGDLVTVINNFLNGELTLRFILKALSVFVVVGSAFVYYVLDARSYWQSHETESKRFGFGAIVLVVAALVLGFMNTETPAEVRAKNIDDRILNDLYTIESAVQQYYFTENVLPENLQAAYYGMQTIPSSPEGRQAYTYSQTNERTYELCAEFAYASEGQRQDPYGDWMGMTWNHDAGMWCFKRFVSKPAVTQ